MNNTKIPAGAREKLPFWFSAAWSGRGAVVIACTSLFGYATFYCTDVLKMNPAVIGILLLSTKLLDGVTDLIIGFLIDKTNTKLGKARPYELAIIFLWIFSVMMFSTPTGLSATGKAIWVFIMYSMVNSVCITMLYGNEVAYLNRAVIKQENKIKLTATSGIYTILLSVVISMIVPQAVKAAGVNPRGWTLIVVGMAVPGIIIGMMRFFFVKEINVDTEPVKLDLKEGISVMSRNKYIWIFAAMYFCYHLANNFIMSAQTYYFQYAVGDIGISSLIGMGMIFVPFLIAAMPKLMTIWGTIKTLRIGFLVMIAALVIRMIGGTNIITLIFGSVLFMAGYVPIAFMLNAYLFECIDYGQWKTGKRVEAMANSITSFVAKIGSALASAGIGFLMGIAGYDGAAAEQSSSAMMSIFAAYNVIPMLVIFIAFIISLKYDLEKKLPQIRSELAEKQ